MFRTGIIGCGKVAHLHAKALQNLKNSEFVAVWSRTPFSAEKFAGQYDVRAYNNITEMVRENKLDLVIVCTPHPFHKDPTNEAFSAGANILVEKPLASSLSDCDSMIASAVKYDKRLGVISQRRWYAPALRVKQAIDEGKIGKPILGTINMLGWRDEDYYNADPWRGTWKDEGGGVLVNQAPHQLDLLLWFMGEIEELYGAWGNLNHPYIEVEDTALAIIRFKNGALGNIIVSNSEKPGIYGKVHVHGKNGASVGVQTDGGAMFVAGMSNVLEPPVNDLWTVPGEELLLDSWIKEDSDFFNSIDPTVYYMERQIEDFLNALTEDRDPLVTGYDGRSTVELFTAIYRSQRDNQVIRFPLQPEDDRTDYDGRI
jgi:predicted dehydrogenase